MGLTPRLTPSNRRANANSGPTQPMPDPANSRAPNPDVGRNSIVALEKAPLKIVPASNAATLSALPAK